MSPYRRSAETDSEVPSPEIRDPRSGDELPPSDPGDSAPRPFGNYVLVRKLATAGVAQVHLGLRLSPVGIERLVTVKWLHEGLSRHRDLVASFLREAQVAGELSHANIVRVLDVGREGGAYFMAMEYVDQEPLSIVLKELRAGGVPVISPAEAVHIAVQLAGALQHAHTKSSLDGAPLGIIHGAISPDNVFVGVTGDVKLGEFGTSGPLRSGRLASRTPYMAPEHVRGEPLDRRADVFAVGVILSELLTGHPQFRGATLPDFSLLEGRRDTRNDEVCPPELERIVLRATAPDKEERYRNAAEMQIDLERLAKNRRYAASPAALAALVAHIFRDREVNYQRQLRDAKAIARSFAASASPAQEPRAAPRFETPRPAPRLETPKLAPPSIPELSPPPPVLPLQTTPPPPLARTVAPPDFRPRRPFPIKTTILALAGALIGIGIGWRLPHHAESVESHVPADAHGPPQDGRLVVESEPSGASVWINDALAATATPVTLEHLPLGRSMMVRLISMGFETSEAHVALSPERPDDHLLITLKKATLALRVQIDAPNSALWIDGRFHGERLVHGLTLGEDHKVAVSAPGHIGKILYVRADQGGERTLDFKLDPAVHITR